MSDKLIIQVNLPESTVEEKIQKTITDAFDTLLVKKGLTSEEFANDMGSIVKNAMMTIIDTVNDCLENTSKSVIKELRRKTHGKD